MFATGAVDAIAASLAAFAALADMIRAAYVPLDDPLCHVDSGINHSFDEPEFIQVARHGYE